MDVCWLGGNSTEIYESGLCWECWVWVAESGVVSPDASEQEIKEAYAEEQARLEAEAKARTFAEGRQPAIPEVNMIEYLTEEKAAVKAILSRLSLQRELRVDDPDARYEINRAMGELQEAQRSLSRAVANLRLEQEA